VQTPKSRAGIRTFAISGSLAEDLRNLVDSTSDNDYGLVFVTDPGRGKRNPGGKPLSMDNFRHRVLNPILKELGIDKKLERMGITRCGNYAFRHMNATLMDSLNTPMKTRQKRLGHAQIETTLKHYTHAIDADDQLAADQIGALLSPKGTRPAQSMEAVPPDILAHPDIESASIESAHLAELMQFSRATGYSLSPLLDRAIGFCLEVEAPVYMEHANREQGQQI
jgi:Phage integrase family